jgi:hypothetical protein
MWRCPIPGPDQPDAPQMDSKSGLCARLLHRSRPERNGSCNGIGEQAATTTGKWRRATSSVQDAGDSRRGRPREPRRQLPSRGARSLAAPARLARETGSAGRLDQNEAVASRCMRCHGVPNLPDPTRGGVVPKVSLHQVGVGDSQLQAAQQACRSLWPTVSATQQQHVRAQALRFSRCMRKQGISD